MAESSRAGTHPLIVRAGGEIHDLRIFVHVCARGLEQSTRAIEAVDLAQRIAEEIDAPSLYPSEDKLEDAKKWAGEIESFSKDQEKQGYSYLFSLGLVRLWSILESVVDDLVADSLRTPEKYKDQNLFYSLKGPLLEFNLASPERQTELLVEKLKDAVRASLKPGVGRFEAILAPIGLGGSTEERVRRVMLEMSQIRNTVLHRSGFADRRLIESCPWLGVKSTQRIQVTALAFQMYSYAAYWYLIELKLRMLALSGGSRPTNTARIRDDAAKMTIDLWERRSQPNSNMESAG